ncbi:MAG TPA: (Fe-S)-binding protein, partial [Polyangia bacterium]
MVDGLMPAMTSRPVVHLFVPCYVDQLYPEVGEATLQVLERAGCDVRFDARQTCCGQPMSNAGSRADAAHLARRHLDVFRGTVSVSPSGSCVAQVRHRFPELGLALD